MSVSLLPAVAFYQFKDDCRVSFLSSPSPSTPKWTSLVIPDGCCRRGSLDLLQLVLMLQEGVAQYGVLLAGRDLPDTV